MSIDDDSEVEHATYKSLAFLKSVLIILSMGKHLHSANPSVAF
jgi:hypothetical protein